MSTTIHHTTAYNSEANGVVERMHRKLKSVLMSRCTETSWYSQLPWVLLGLMTTPKDSFSASLTEIVYSRPVVTPGEFFPDTSSNEDLNRLKANRREVCPLPIDIQTNNPPIRPQRPPLVKVRLPQKQRQFAATHSTLLRPL